MDFRTSATHLHDATERSGGRVLSLPDELPYHVGLGEAAPLKVLPPGHTIPACDSKSPDRAGDAYRGGHAVAVNLKHGGRERDSAVTVV